MAQHNLTHSRFSLVKKSEESDEKIFHNIYNSKKSEYSIIAHLGDGGFCEVLKAFHKPTKSVVAMKKEIPNKRKKGAIKEECIRILKQEAEILSQLSHPNIVTLLDHFEDDGLIYIILEYSMGGDLSSWQYKQGGKLSENEIAKIIYQVLEAVEYLHSKGYIHRDIKRENILLKNKTSNKILLSDFGCAYPIHTEIDYQNGTLEYTAPELLTNDKEKAEPGIDAWSIGVLTFMLFCGHGPFTRDNGARTVTNICRGRFFFLNEDWEGRSDGAKSFIRGLLTIDRVDRLSINGALNDGWLLYEVF